MKTSLQDVSNQEILEVLQAFFLEVDRRFDAVDTRLDRVEHRLTGVDGRLLGVEHWPTKVKATLGNSDGNQ